MVSVGVISLDSYQAVFPAWEGKLHCRAHCTKISGGRKFFGWQGSRADRRGSLCPAFACLISGQSLFRIYTEDAFDAFFIPVGGDRDGFGVWLIVRFNVSKGCDVQWATLCPAGGFREG